LENLARKSNCAGLWRATVAAASVFSQVMAMDIDPQTFAALPDDFSGT